MVDWCFALAKPAEHIAVCRVSLTRNASHPAATVIFRLVEPRQGVGESRPAGNNKGLVSVPPATAHSRPGELTTCNPSLALRALCRARLLCEGETPLATSRYQIGFLAACAIVALRLGIGLHFFSQGVEKLGTSFSAGFLGNAKGPFAPLYKNMIWDRDGYSRLNGDATAAYWDHYRNRIVAHYHFDDEQQAAAKKTLDAHTRSLRAYLDEKGDDINQYVKSVERRDANKTDDARSDLASFRAHDARIEAERTQLIQPILTTIDNLWKNLENDLNAIATTVQWKAHGRLAIGKIGEQWFDSAFVDRFIPLFDITVGLCLILGLFTRPAAILGGLFLASVCISQWPGSPGAVPIYPYLIEMLALFVLAAIGAGQIAGLDFLFSGLRRYCWPAKPAAGSVR